MPPGHYLVKLPEQGGLTDLAGYRLSLQDSLQASWDSLTWLSGKVEPDPLDLGALLPAAATAGVPIDVILSQGQSITYRVVVTVPGQYIFQEQSSGDPPSVQITGPALDRPLSPTGTNDTLLSPGVYSIRFEAPTGGPVQVHLFFRLSSDQTEIVLANGVGQGPALSLRLITYSEDPVAPPSVAIITGPDSSGRFRRSFRHRFPRGRPIPFQDPPPARFVPIPRPCEVSRSQGHRPPRLRSWAWEAIWSGAPPSQPLVRRLRSGRLSRHRSREHPRRGAWSVTQGPPAWSREIPLGVCQFDRRESRGRSGKTACPGNHDRLRSRQGNRDRCWFAAMGYPARGVLSELGRILVRRTTHVRSDQHPRHTPDPRARPPPVRDRIATKPGGQCG